MIKNVKATITDERRSRKICEDKKYSLLGGRIESERKVIQINDKVEEFQICLEGRKYKKNKVARGKIIKKI